MNPIATAILITLLIAFLASLTTLHSARTRTTSIRVLAATLPPALVAILLAATMTTMQTTALSIILFCVVLWLTLALGVIAPTRYVTNLTAPHQPPPVTTAPSTHNDLLAEARAFAAHTVADVMIPTSRLVTITPRTTPNELDDLVTRTGYSRFPITDTDATTMTGYIHIKDTLHIDDHRRDHPLDPATHRALAVARSNDSVSDALLAMQHSGAHLARVLDGTTTIGVVFLEDVIEKLVGEIRDSMQRPTWRDDHPADPTST